MARRKKDETPMTEAQTKAKQAIMASNADREVIRDAFLEGRDELAVTMLRQNDARDHLKRAASSIRAAEVGLRDMPPTCYGAVQRFRAVSEAIGAASENLDMLPHEWREKGSKLFGRRNQMLRRLQETTQILQSNCGGTGSRAFENVTFRDDPRNGIPTAPVPLDGTKKRRR